MAALTFSGYDPSHTGFAVAPTVAGGRFTNLPPPTTVNASVSLQLPTPPAVTTGPAARVAVARVAHPAATITRL